MELLVYLLLWGIRIYTYIIIGSVLMSWVPSIKESRFGQFITSLADPYLNIFRKFIPPLGMIDLSPIVAIIALGFVSQGIIVLYNSVAF